MATVVSRPGPIPVNASMPNSNSRGAFRLVCANTGAERTHDNSTIWRRNLTGAMVAVTGPGVKITLVTGVGAFGVAWLVCQGAWVGDVCAEVGEAWRPALRRITAAAAVYFTATFWSAMAEAIRLMTAGRPRL